MTGKFEPHYSRISLFVRKQKPAVSGFTNLPETLNVLRMAHRACYSTKRCGRDNISRPALVDQLGLFNIFV
jgi:hypothetical protein